MFTCIFRHFLIEFCWNINMWNRIFQRVSLLIILLSFWVLLKGRQSYQNITMLCNECMHTFLYVIGHCGKYMLGLLLILILKFVGGGVLLHFCLLMPYFSYKYSHMRHHINMGSINRDEVFVPKKKKKRLLLQLQKVGESHNTFSIHWVES